MWTNLGFTILTHQVRLPQVPPPVPPPLPPTPAISPSLISSFHKSPFRHVASAPPAPLSSSFTLSPPFCNRGRPALIICRPSTTPAAPPTLIHFPAAPLLIYHASFFCFFFCGSGGLAPRRMHPRLHLSWALISSSCHQSPSGLTAATSDLSVHASLSHSRLPPPSSPLPGTWFPPSPSIHLPPSLPGKADRTAARRGGGAERWEARHWLLVKRQRRQRGSGVSDPAPSIAFCLFVFHQDDTCSP